MHRRRYLTVAGTGALGSVAGCTGALEDDACSAGDDPAAEFDLEFAGYTEADRHTDENYHVAGTVVDQRATRVVVDDGTGLAALSVGDREYVFDTDEFDVGDCVGGTGPIRIGRSAVNEVPHVALDPESLEHGSSDREATPLPDRPDQDVSSDYNGLDEELTVTVTGAAEIPSDQLLVRWRAPDSDTPWTRADREWWHELTDVAPGEPIPDGSQFTREISSYEGFDYSALWLSDDRGWSRQLDQLKSDPR